MREGDQQNGYAKRSDAPCAQRKKNVCSVSRVCDGLSVAQSRRLEVDKAESVLVVGILSLGRGEEAEKE